MRYVKPLTNESGFVMIATILTLVSITVLGLTLSKLSNIETLMSTNERCKEQARFNSESISLSTAKLIRHITDLDAKGIIGIPEGDPLAQGVEYPSGDERDFYNLLVDPNAGGGTCRDVIYENANIPGDMDIRPLGPSSVAGGRALEFATGYTQGVGVGSTTGGTALWYITAARGDGCDNAKHITYMRYRKTIGVAGGI